MPEHGARDINLLPTRRRLSVSLLQWVVLALVIVGLLPFLVSFYQIRNSRAAIIRQAQATHLVAARAAADRVAAYLELVRSLGEAIAFHPDVASAPGSATAAAALTSFVGGHQDIAAAGLYVIENDPVLIQIARHSADRQAVEAALKEDDPEPLAATWTAGELLIRLRIPLAGTRQELFLVARAREMVEEFVPVELGEEADLVLVGHGGEIVAGNVDSLDGFPPAVLEAAALLGSGVAEYELDGGESVVCAHADVSGSPWFVLSRQPARVAEAAATAMRRAAWRAFSAVLGVVVLLAIGAQVTIVRPIRRLAEAQRRLVGSGNLEVPGGEIAELESSFALLERHLHDREALSKVFLGRYQVVDVLGAGAMGTVFRGWDPRLQRYVALKTVKLGADQVDEGRRNQLTSSLLKEAVTLARLQHPHIVTVFDVLEEGAVAFIAMELINGASLERYLWRRKRLPSDQVIPLGAAVFKALAAAHQQGFVHHDVKPANVLLGRDGVIKVTDFGIADILSKAASTQDVVVGTPGYLAPETLRGNGYTEKSDLFGAGVVLYESLTGQHPFPGTNVRQRVISTLRAEVAPPSRQGCSLPPRLERLLLDLLAKDPEARPADAATAASELDVLAAEIGCHWKPDLRLEEKDGNEIPTNHHRTLLANVPTTHRGR